MPKPSTLFLLFFLVSGLASAQEFRGQVTDSTGKPLAFATIKFGNTKQGMMADLNGVFRFPQKPTFNFITVSYLGFKTKRIDLAQFPASGELDIILEASEASLEDVVITSSSSKLRRIIGAAMANRNLNNPEKYDWYQCMVYYKTTVDFRPADSTGLSDTSEDARQLRAFMDSQHLFITETYSKRSWERPQKLQEDVIASRISGFRKAWFTSLVTDVLPFHAYSDFLSFNGKDYHNPISAGAFQRFRFKIEDEVLQGADTVWQISFRPRKDPDHLSGSIYIHSKQFAIAHLLASHHDSALNRTVGVEQQYQYLEGKWFPEQLNYFIQWKNLFGTTQSLYMKGTSLIDSVSFSKEQGFRFDKAHTARLRPGADALADSSWRRLRPQPLVEKELRTYEFLDSLGRKHHFDRIPALADKISQGLWPMGHVDLDLQRIYSFNNFEKHRLGFGLKTSDKISRHFRLGGWFAYGTGDRMWKYGASSELYLDRYKEFVLRLDHYSDLQDPGRLQINQELDKNFLRRFTLGRVDRVNTWNLELSKKLGYWNLGLGLNMEELRPQYQYSVAHSGKNWSQFDTREIVFSLRYAYAERMAPLFNRYVSAGTKYPVFYSKIRVGEISQDGNRYLQALAAVKWQKHINRWGNEKFLLIGGAAFSRKPLPLSKLFAGNGFRTDDNAFYAFGGMLTMLPYQYYTDRFINFYWQHDFDFRFFRAKLSRGLSTAPSPSIGYNLLWGKLRDPSAHQFVQFSVPDPAYHEAGGMINKLLRMKFAGMYHLNLNLGYYYHLKGRFNHKENGRIVFGLGVDL